MLRANVFTRTTTKESQANNKFAPAPTPQNMLSAAEPTSEAPAIKSPPHSCDDGLSMT